jgi:hypothetical protein
MGAQAGRVLGGAELIAPPLLWSDVPSTLIELSFRDEISEGLAQHALERPLISPRSSEPPDSSAENPARPGRFERPTSRSGGERSIH